MSECQTVKILIGPDHFFGPDLGPNCLPPFTRPWLNFFTLTFTGQKSHCVNTAVKGIAMLCFLIFESEKNIQRSDVCADFSSKYDVFTSLFNNLSLY